MKGSIPVWFLNMGGPLALQAIAAQKSELEGKTKKKKK
jgi:hypothetical protein